MDDLLESEGHRGPSRWSTSSHYIKGSTQKWSVLQENHLDPLFANSIVSPLNDVVTFCVGVELLFVMLLF